MFSGFLKTVKNIFSSSDYDSDQRHNLPREAIAGEISISQRHQPDHLIMVQTRRRSQATGESKGTSTPESVDTKKRSRVATHVEIVVSNKRRRLQSLKEYVDTEADENNAESEEQQTTGNSGTKGDDDEVAAGSGKEQEDTAAEDVGDAQDKTTEKVSSSNVADESTSLLPTTNSTSRNKRRRKSRKKLDSVVADEVSGKPMQQDRHLESENAKDKPGEKLSSITNGVSPGKAQAISKHIKFGDDEPSGPSLIEATSEPPKRPEEDPSPPFEQTEDEDEAPEAESLSVAQSKAKARTRDAARAIERQEADAREKRRKRDKRLKEQASLQKSKRQRQTRADSPQPTAPADMDNAEDTGPTMNSILGNKHSGLLDASELPDLLPDEILAAKPYVRPTQSDKAGRQKQTCKKHILFRSEEKRPKDIERGGVRVRVLETSNPKLPPKSGKDGKAVRERWLAGRSGKGGGIERRKMGSTFLRR